MGLCLYQYAAVHLYMGEWQYTITDLGHFKLMYYYLLFLDRKGFI